MATKMDLDSPSPSSPYAVAATDHEPSRGRSDLELGRDATDATVDDRGADETLLSGSLEFAGVDSLDDNLGPAKPGELAKMHWMSRITLNMFGMHLVGGSFNCLQGLAHCICSVFVFSTLCLSIFVFLVLVFGFSEGGAAIITGVQFVGNLCQIPAERYKFSDPLLAVYTRRNSQKLREKIRSDGSGTMIFTVFFFLIWLGFPLIAFGISGGFATGFATTYTHVICYCLTVLSPLCMFLCVGWFPVELIYSPYLTHLTKTLVKELSDQTLILLLDDKLPPKTRLKRLSDLYNKRGRSISRSLRGHINPSSLWYLPCSMFSMIGAFFQCFPEMIGGLPHLENAMLPQPGIRITISIMLFFNSLFILSYGSLQGMAISNILFYERLRGEIFPDGAKLHTALECFPTGTEDLLVWLRNQNICLKIFGVRIDSQLPGKIAAGCASIIVTVALALLRDGGI